ncbi:MAG TPA: AmmeMemoRadiSam system protein A [Chromatiales bacterium]|nr:AmmeMemoRadiSam system protein A [Thiotrichales bacterium]HIP67241.1 AmmeMemoRadiSam system protein A [Chromatiales bacterium]
MALIYLTDEQRSQLLQVARKSIHEGCEKNAPLPVDVKKFEAALQNKGASFVTLKIEEALRGCIGTLEASRPLVQDVSSHAFAAAFTDPRFSPVTRDELELITISISVLTPAEKIEFKDELDLLEKINPGVDGLILEAGRYRGTFLPAVWKSLPEKIDFLQQLKRKAGLPENYWSEEISVSRYHTVEFAES